MTPGTGHLRRVASRRSIMRDRSGNPQPTRDLSRQQLATGRDSSRQRLRRFG
jgi:hypothetical protein